VAAILHQPLTYRVASTNKIAKTAPGMTVNLDC
jgi:hypothetical protein